MNNVLKLSEVMIEKRPGEIRAALEHIRQSFGYTHREMCVLMGISEDTYMRWRRTNNFAGVFLFQMTTCPDPAMHIDGKAD